LKPRSIWNGHYFLFSPTDCLCIREYTIILILFKVIFSPFSALSITQHP
jgi:hypothetical protein